MQHAFLKELRGNWIHRARFNDGAGKSKVNEFESFHVHDQTSTLLSKGWVPVWGTSRQSEYFAFPATGSLWKWPSGPPERWKETRDTGEVEGAASPKPDWRRSRNPLRIPPGLGAVRVWRLLFKKVHEWAFASPHLGLELIVSLSPSLRPLQSFIPKARGSGRWWQGVGKFLALAPSPSKTIRTYTVSPTAVLDEENTVIINNMCSDSMN